MRPTDDRQRPRQDPAADEATQLNQTLADGTIVPEPDGQGATVNSDNRASENAADGGTLGDPQLEDQTLCDAPLARPSVSDEPWDENQTLADPELTSDRDDDNSDATLGDATDRKSVV